MKTKIVSKSGNQQGYVFVPYIMSITSSVIIQSDFTPKMLLNSRYGTATIDGKFYTTYDELVKQKKINEREEKLKGLLDE